MFFNTNKYIETLESTFSTNKNYKIAQQQKAYLRDKFEFYGLKTPERRQLQKPFLVKEYLPPKSELNSIVKTCFKKPQRDYHYFAQELTHKYTKQFILEDITLLEYLITHNSWWDTVDFIATKLVSAYFLKYPEQISVYIEKWLKSNNIWLQRTCLLFQLQHKGKTDVVVLAHVINHLLGSKEFFINKAIGWALRNYSRTNPKWVTLFVSTTALAPLSKKEALRLIS